MASGAIPASAAGGASPYGQLPNASRPGCFPREHVAAGETIIYETRPSVIPYVISGIIWLIIGLIFFLPLLRYPTFFLYVWGFIWVVLPIISILVGIIRWSRTAFAITDKRVFRAYGLISRSTNDCMHDKIQTAMLRQGVLGRAAGYGSLIYQTAGVNVSNEARVAASGGVFWRGVLDPVNTRRFVQEVIEVAKRQQKISEFQDMARVLQASGASMPGVPPAAAMAGAQGTVVCPKCGARQAPGRFCNSCGSPLA